MSFNKLKIGDSTKKTYMIKQNKGKKTHVPWAFLFRTRKQLIWVSNNDYNKKHLLNMSNMPTNKNVTARHPTTKCIPFTIIINIACQKGGIAFGGSIIRGYKRSSFLYHQYTATTCHMNIMAIATRMEILLSPC